MSKIAFIFPGQGAQYSGMGKELTEISKAAKEVFTLGDEKLSGISTLCFSGSEDDLKKTKNAQPCIFLTEMAASRALREQGITPDATAGFSLGELSAICEAGILSLEETLSLVIKRGELMDKAASETEAFMAAVLRLDNETVEEICSRFTEVYPVNYNCPGQISVSGLKSLETDFLQAVKEAKGRAIPLKVSGGFHSPFMKSASIAFKEVLDDKEFSDPDIPIYANLTGEKYEGDVAETLADQIASPVRWETIVRQMISDGIDTFIEVGPGNTLSGMVQRIDSSVKVLRVCDKETLESTVAEIKG